MSLNFLLCKLALQNQRGSGVRFLINLPLPSRSAGTNAGTERKGSHRRSCVWHKAGTARQSGRAIPSVRNFKEQVLAFNHGIELPPGRGRRHMTKRPQPVGSHTCMRSRQGSSRSSKAPPSKYRPPRLASLTFCPAGLTTRNVLPVARLIQVTWDTDLYSALLPELGASASRFEHLHGHARPFAEPNRHEFGPGNRRRLR